MMKPLIGCILIACLLAVGCAGSSPTPTPIPVPIPTHTPEPTPTPRVGSTSVPTLTSPALVPVSTGMVSTTNEARRGQEFSVDLTLDPAGRGISGVQVQIEYDPAIFQAVVIEPRTLLGQEPVEVPIIDEAKGVIEYAAARIGPTQPPTPSGLFATMRFRVLETATAGRETSLRITEVKIADENIEEVRDVLIDGELRVAIPP